MKNIVIFTDKQSADLENMLNNNPEKIVLGCTHYPYLTDVLSKFSSKELFIDPAEYFVDYIIKDLKSNNLLNNSNNSGSEKIYVSANPEQFKIAAEMFYHVDKTPILINN